jgi:hypothetical protein
MAKIFLAHANQDKPRVRKLYADLKTRGFDPWLDEIDLVWSAPLGPDRFRLLF